MLNDKTSNINHAQYSVLSFYMWPKCGPLRHKQPTLCLSYFLNSQCLVQGLAFMFLIHTFWVNGQEAENMDIHSQCFL